MLCNLCPRRCNADRDSPEGRKRALCRAGWTPRVALVSLHAYEEPPIAGAKGAGTVFFSHCNLRCVFCQNFDISTEGKGIDIDAGRLAEIFLEQQDRGAATIDLVSPAHYTESILPALRQAKSQGLRIPVVYNSNGYELPEVLERYAGLVDIFLPDLKYKDETMARHYSAAPHYFEAATRAIETMMAMVGPLALGEDGIAKRGVLVRHLVLPWGYKDSMACIDWLCERFGNETWLSLMNQYMPLYHADRIPRINRPLTTLEYDRVVNHAADLGMKNVFIQTERTDQAKYIPIFDGSRVLATNR